jgi:molecular chaperone DnaJ
VRGDDLRLDLKLDFREAIFGGEKEIRISHLETCEVCTGSGAKPGTRPRTCSTCSGSGQVRRVTRTPFGSFTQVSTCPTCDGTGTVVEDKCDACDGKGANQVTKKLKINVPAGVDNGTRLRVSQEGDAGQRGGPPGDLYVYLFVNEDEEFHRDGINIISEIKISYLQAILGCRLEVNTVDGLVELMIPSGTQPNTVMKLENRGVPRLGNPVSRGDHMLTILIDIPTKIIPEERELLEKLAKIKGDRTGKGGLEGFLGGLFKS